MKTKKLQYVLNHFDGAALLTMKKLTNEERTLLIEYINNLGAWSVVPAARPQDIKRKHDRNNTTITSTPIPCRMLRSGLFV